MKRPTRSAILNWTLDKLAREAGKRGYPLARLFFLALKSRLRNYPGAYQRESWEPVNIRLRTVLCYPAKIHKRNLSGIGDKEIRSTRAFIKSLDPTLDFIPDKPIF
ncbi:hypothetical protein GF382_00725 [Candidatus Falkowbacteria bacterium]|nr:hypothetical protein [Candidatus Falkowbacteria bacterium]